MLLLLLYKIHFHFSQWQITRNQETHGFGEILPLLWLSPRGSVPLCSGLGPYRADTQIGSCSLSRKKRNEHISSVKSEPSLAALWDSNMYIGQLAGYLATSYLKGKQPHHKAVTSSFMCRVYFWVKEIVCPGCQMPLKWNIRCFRTLRFGIQQ